MTHKSFLHYLIIALNITLFAYGMEEDPNEQLTDAIAINNIINVKKLLYNKKVDVNYKRIHGFTPLISAMDYIKLEIAELLIDEGADIDLANENGITPLMYAAFFTTVQERNIDIVHLLIRKGANINLTDTEGNSALLYACHNKNIKGAQLLLQHGANINIVNTNGNTPLIAASYADNALLTELLLKHNASIDNKINDGQTARSIAAEKKYWDIVKLIDNKVKRIKFELHNQKLLYYFKQQPSIESLLACKREQK